eukprot:Blabericola_migrator_1__2323@NODE_1649_length_4098_cov_131_273877_g1073_i0_p1_GENE_NODE_1649_length_4098_cov_131_273877_g1073_i0NODE_1649_length_4098_cov_131_273877_g1073_i0_p1_ORF_typecomplete_len515_score76_52RMI1_N/PF08585_12/0_0011_NODE_1649_length_4098_cov_131_273877_g1073_i019243468
MLLSAMDIGDIPLHLVLSGDWRLRALQEDESPHPLSLEQYLRKKATLLDPIAQPPFVSDPGRWWFQIVDASNVALPLYSRERWAPGRVDPESAKRRLQEDVDAVNQDDDVESEEDVEDTALHQGYDTAKRGTARRTMRLTLLELNPRQKDPVVPQTFINGGGESNYLVAYELPEIPQLDGFVEHFRKLSEADHLRLRGNLGRILLEGPLNISFNRVILLKPQNVKLCIPMKLHQHDHGCRDGDADDESQLGAEGDQPGSSSSTSSLDNIDKDTLLDHEPTQDPAPNIPVPRQGLLNSNRLQVPTDVQNLWSSHRYSSLRDPTQELSHAPAQWEDLEALTPPPPPATLIPPALERGGTLQTNARASIELFRLVTPTKYASSQIPPPPETDMSVRAVGQRRTTLPDVPTTSPLDSFPNKTSSMLELLPYRTVSEKIHRPQSPYRTSARRISEIPSTTTTTTGIPSDKSRFEDAAKSDAAVSRDSSVQTGERPSQDQKAPFFVSMFSSLWNKKPSPC